eukprot:CAMPEP_0172630330 /NCGR_PEP_ID=MMETSP1068-20121228/173208_1 /TAXON_ID=35684 /ORGANISM="Pseudopedinella elastica, Strain CCMP716" /LENGTH=139 /DNA_ID=CAMNT_0013441153 /DNA_START=17 /DNA_END=436 /DNA_ORIENTATION=+
MTGRSPWSSNSDKTIIKKEIRNNTRVKVPSQLSPEVGMLIHDFLTPNAKIRLGSKSEDEILSHPFFKGVDWAAIEKQENPPAFVPPAVATEEKDRYGALDAYLSGGGAVRARMGGSGQGWTIGLQTVHARPLYSPESES